jgi:NADPH:quinone reductase
MRAVVIDQGKLSVQERPDPVPADTEVLVAVRAAGLNGADIMQRAGRYPAPPGAPADIPGMEIAGEVVEVGSQVRQAQPGDRVMALVAGGGQATMAVVTESHLVPVPDEMTWAEAGGFPEVFSTAYDALFTQAGLSIGDRLLVTGAAGGVGVAAVQLGAAAGATVVASVRDPDKRDDVAGLGAHRVVAPDELAEHSPFDVVLELVGAASLPQVIPTLATGARVAVIGVGSGAKIELNLLDLMGRRARIGGSTLRSRTRAEKAAVAVAVRAHVLPLVVAGAVCVPVWARFPLDEVEAAYDRFTEGGKLGKIVLEM